MSAGPVTTLDVDTLRAVHRRLDELVQHYTTHGDPQTYTAVKEARNAAGSALAHLVVAHHLSGAHDG